MKLIYLGWDNTFENYFVEYRNEDFVPERVVTQNRNNHFLIFEKGTINAKLSGRIYYSAS